jgi:hypothetical protein
MTNTGDLFSDFEGGGTPQPRRRGCGGNSCLFGCVIGCGISVLFIVVLFAALAWLGYKFWSENTTQDPAKAGQWLEEIVPSQIPDGYAAKFAIRIPFIELRTVVILPEGIEFDEPQRPAGEQPTMFIIVSAPNMDEDDMRNHLRAQPGIDIGDGRAEEMKQVEVKVGGQPTKATRIEGTNDAGHRFVSYQVRVRPDVLLISMGSAEGFDQPAFEAFLASIKPAPQPAGEPIPQTEN